MINNIFIPMYAAFIAVGHLWADERAYLGEINLVLIMDIVFGFVAIAVAFSAKKKNKIMWAGLFPLIGLFLLLGFGLVHGLSGEYGKEKAISLYTIILVSTIAPAFFLNSIISLRAFLFWLMIAGVVISVPAEIKLLLSSGGLLRLDALGADTITLARWVSVAFIWVFMSLLLGKEEKLGKVLYIVLVLFLFILMVASGSRGPILAAVVGISTYFVFTSSLSERLKFFLYLCMGLMVGFLNFPVLIEFLPVESIGRIGYLINGEIGRSEGLRLQAWGGSISEILNYPFGSGFGEFYSVVGLYLSEKMEYPHNILLEVFIEAGWFAGIWMMAIMLLAFNRSLALVRLAGKSSCVKEMGILLVLFVSALINSFISGDITSNKLVFVCMVAIFSIHMHKRVFARECVSAASAKAQGPS